jgi:hypothetical protein
LPRSGFGAFRCARPKSDPQAREAFESFAAKVQADLPDAVRGKKIEVWRRHKVRVGRQGTLTRIRAGARALRVPDNITLMPLPPHTPQINPVENVRACLRANKTAISVFNSYHDIVDRYCKAWNVFANNPATVRSITTRDYTNRINI